MPGGQAADVGPAYWEGRALDRSLGPALERSNAAARRLVDATRTLAARRSSSDFTMAEVAAEAHVSLRTVYRHFAGRDDLLLALFEEEARLGATLVAEAMAEVAAEERLRQYVVSLCALLVTGEGYATLLLREHLQLGQRRPDELRAALSPLVDLLEAELAASAAAGSIRSVDRHDAVLLFTTVLAHALAVVLFPPDDDSARSAERLWAFCAAALATGDTPMTGPASPTTTRSTARRGSRR